MITVTDLQKSYQNQPIFEPLNFSIKPSQIIVLMGANGAGKTTILKCLAGYLDYEKGAIDFIDDKESQIKKGFHFSQENSFFPQLTLEQNIRFFKRLFKIKKDHQPLVEELKLTPWLKKPFQECSTGIKKRMGLLRSLLNEPQLLLIDEPFSSMDPRFSHELGQFLYKKTKDEQLMTIITSNQKLPRTFPVNQILEVKAC